MCGPERDGSDEGGGQVVKNEELKMKNEKFVLNHRYAISVEFREKSYGFGLWWFPLVWFPSL
jgi:hypothetical protein